MLIATTSGGTWLRRAFFVCRASLDDYMPIPRREIAMQATTVAIRRAALNTPKCRGVTLLEVLVVIGLITLLAALMLPAIQLSRESSRRAQCLSNLRQISVAVQSYVALHRVFPPSSSFQSAILPQLEFTNVYGLVNYSADGGMPQNSAARSCRVAVYHCPSDGAGWDTAGTDYAGNFGSGAQAYGYNGIIRPLNGVPGIDPDLSGVYTVHPASVTDGLSHTAVASEILIALDGQEDGARAIWQTPVTLPLPSQLNAFANECESMEGPLLYVPLRGVSWLLKDQSLTGYNHVLPPNRNSCTNGQSVQIGAYTAKSLHGNGVNVSFADGHACFIGDEVALAVWRALGSRNNGESLQY